MSKTEILARLQSELADWPGLKVALLFGSLAKDTATTESDLDLAVQMTKPLTVDQKMDLISHLADVFGRPIDIVDLREAGQPLLGEIVSTGLLVRGTNQDRGDLLFRSIMDQEDFGPYQQRILRGRQKQWLEQTSRLEAGFRGVNEEEGLAEIEKAVEQSRKDRG